MANPYLPASLPDDPPRNQRSTQYTPIHHDPTVHPMARLARHPDHQPRRVHLVVDRRELGWRVSPWAAKYAVIGRS